MDNQTLIAFFAVAIMFIAWFSTARLRNKVLCTYIRPSTQEIEKFVKMQAEYVIFDGYKFDIVPNCAIPFWYDRGIHKFFPTWVMKYEYVWYSRWPRNPKEFHVIAMDSPTVRNAINKREDAEAFAKKAVQTGATTKKFGVLREYLPWIALLLAFVVGFMWYNDHQQLGSVINYLKGFTPKP